MRFTWKLAASVAVSAAVLPVGLAACAPVPKAFACTAAVSVAQPTVGTVQSIAVTSTAPGVRIMVTAGTTHLAGLTNAHGATTLAFPVTSAGRTVVAVAADTGSRFAGCATSFTAKPAVTAAIAPSKAISTLSLALTTHWDQNAIGTLVSGQPSDCRDAFGFPACGQILLKISVSGYSQYDGIPAPNYPTQDPVTGAVSCATPCSNSSGSGPRATGTALISYQLSCNATGVLTTRSDVPVAISPQSRKESATATIGGSRVSADEAELRVVARVPLDHDRLDCPGGSTLLAESARAITVHIPAGYGAPESDFTFNGPFNRTTATA